MEKKILFENFYIFSVCPKAIERKDLSYFLKRRKKLFFHSFTASGKFSSFKKNFALILNYIFLNFDLNFDGCFKVCKIRKQDGLHMEGIRLQRHQKASIYFIFAKCYVKNNLKTNLKAFDR